MQIVCAKKFLLLCHLRIFLHGILAQTANNIKEHSKYWNVYGCSYYVGIASGIIGGFSEEHNASIMGKFLSIDFLGASSLSAIVCPC